MTAPKPGDRVRVTETYEGVWTSRPTHGSGMWGVVAAKDFDVDFQVTNYAKVEVLPRPVYVNSDTAEYRSGDVVRVDKPNGTGVIRPGECFVRQDDHWSRLGDACYYHDDHVSTSVQVRLLVRDGQVIQP